MGWSLQKAENSEMNGQSGRQGEEETDEKWSLLEFHSILSGSSRILEESLQDLEIFWQFRLDSMKKALKMSVKITERRRSFLKSSNQNVIRMTAGRRAAPDPDRARTKNNNRRNHGWSLTMTTQTGKTYPQGLYHVMLISRMVGNWRVINPVCNPFFLSGFKWDLMWFGDSSGSDWIWSHAAVSNEKDALGRMPLGSSHANIIFSFHPNCSLPTIFVLMIGSAENRGEEEDDDFGEFSL